MKLDGKVAVVTGAASGMGKAIAILYAQEGAKVVVADMNEEGINAVVAEIKGNGGSAKGIVTNVSKEEDINNMINTAVNEFGSLDILVNNAGIMDNYIGLAGLTNELWERVIAINLTGPMMASRLAVKMWTEKEVGGVIVNTASVGGLFGTRGGAAYVPSKHALVGLTKNIAAVYGARGIRCNAIAPGGVVTNIGTTMANPDMETMGISSKGSGVPPMGEADQIATVALFLASDDSSFVNGATIVADGGWTAF